MSRILIIEDEEAIRRVLVKILSEENSLYKVFEAVDGLTGTELIKKEDFDLILCDIKMPKWMVLKFYKPQKNSNQKFRL